MRGFVLGSALATFAVGLVAPGLPAGAGGNKEVEALLQADRDFATETARRGGNGWTDWFTPDGVMFPPSGKVEGQDAIRERMVPAFQGNIQLRWEPTTGVVAESGDLGYTLGTWQQVMVQEGAADSVMATGNYVSIWKKTKGSGWRVAVDIGNTD